MTDKLDTGRPATSEIGAVPSGVLVPVAMPTVLVFTDVASLADSLRRHEPAPPGEHLPVATERGVVATPPPAPASGTNGHAVASVDHAVPATAAAPTTVGTTAAPALPHLASPTPQEIVTDEERTRYGLLLDSAAERGLLDPADYEIRLRELAGATTTAQMVELVAELPAFAPAAPTSAPTRSRRAIQSANRAGAAGAAAGQRRRVVMWVLMGLLVVVAVASLIILALSAERLSRSRNSSPPPAPVATQPVSALRL